MSEPITPPASDKHLPHGLAIRRGVYVVKIAIKGHRRAFSTAIRAAGFKLTKTPPQGTAGRKVAEIELITPDKALLLASKVAEIWQKAASGHLSPEEATQELFRISPEGTPRPWLRYNKLSKLLSSINPLTVESYLNSYLQERIEDSQFKRIRNVITRFLDSLGEQGHHLPLARLKPAHCEPFIKEQIQRSSLSTFKQVKGFLSTPFNRAKERGLIAHNPFKELSLEKLYTLPSKRIAQTYKRGLFTLEQLQYMIANFEPHLAYIVLMCSLTARSMQDVCRIMWHDINVRTCLLSSHQQAMRKASNIPAIPYQLLAVMIDKYKNRHCHPWNQALELSNLIYGMGWGAVYPELEERFYTKHQNITRAFTCAIEKEGFTALNQTTESNKRRLTHDIRSINPSIQAILQADGRFTPEQIQAQFSANIPRYPESIITRQEVASHLLALLVPDVASGALARLFSS